MSVGFALYLEIKCCINQKSDPLPDNDPKRQLREVITSLSLEIEPNKIFTRCLLCNNKLKEIQREDAGGKVPDYIFESHRDFSLCNKCKRIFWKGTHHEHVLTVLKECFPCASNKDM